MSAATSTDTEAEAREVWFSYLRSISGSQRSAMMAEMCDEANDICRGGIRSRHPEYTDEQVHHAFLRIVLGDALLQEAFPAIPLVQP